MRLRRIILIFAIAILVGQAARAQNSPVTSHIPRQRVTSRGIVSVGYSHRRQILEIEFTNGAIYRYLEVPASVHRELMSRDSKARFYDENIRGQYHSVHVRPRVE
jgi:hypothetical protein